jgi:hypothetical protein
MKDDEMGGAYGTNGRDEKLIQNVGRRRIILERILK